MYKKYFSLIAAVIAVFLFTCSSVVFAAEDITLDLSEGSIIISQDEGNIVFTQNENVVEVSSDWPFANIIQTTDETHNFITVESDVEVELDIENLNVYSLSNSIEMKSGSSLGLCLIGENILTSVEGCGIHVPEGAELHIGCENDGSIVATAGGVTSSGIGGCGFVEPYEDNGSVGSTGKIVINDGKVTAIGGDSGCGIGGTSRGEVIINGGTVVATGAEKSYSGTAGIGGNADCSIEINGGTIDARGGAGIGGGSRNKDSATIEINGGDIYSYGYAGAGIGGSSGSGGVINISDGTILALGTKSAGIGGYGSSEGGNITITGGDITVATISGESSGIGSGRGGSAGNINISNASIHFTDNSTARGEVNLGDEYPVIGIGSGYHGKGGTVTITNSTLDGKVIGHVVGGGESENGYGLDSLVLENVTDNTKSIWIDISDIWEGKPRYQERINNYNVQVPAVNPYTNEVTFETNAESNSVITYQWQDSFDNKIWNDLEGKTKSSLNLIYSNTINQNYRCIITNAFGNTVTTNSVRPYVPEFVENISDIEVTSGEEVYLHVSLNHEGTLRWEKSTDGGNTWTEVRNDPPVPLYDEFDEPYYYDDYYDDQLYWEYISNTSYHFNATEEDNGTMYRCVDVFETFEVYSNVATISVLPVVEDNSETQELPVENPVVTEPETEELVDSETEPEYKESELENVLTDEETTNSNEESVDIETTSIASVPDEVKMDDTDIQLPENTTEDFTLEVPINIPEQMVEVVTIMVISYDSEGRFIGTNEVKLTKDEFNQYVINAEIKNNSNLETVKIFVLNCETFAPMTDNAEITK